MWKNNTEGLEGECLFSEVSNLLALRMNLSENLNSKIMNVTNPELVLVRGINSEWFKENFSQLWVGFSGAPQAIPKEDSYYVGLYLEAPISAITHFGIVERIESYDGGVDYFLKALVKLKTPIKPGHAIRKHENWKLSDFGLTKAQMDDIRLQLNAI